MNEGYRVEGEALRFSALLVFMPYGSQLDFPVKYSRAEGMGVMFLLILILVLGFAENVRWREGAGEGNGRGRIEEG